MEYEKHIKRLVLGYLKNECKSSYKVFLKYNFHNCNKHIATRVAGQTLEDILRIYSRIQEIIQGRLEDTDYYRNNKPDFSSPLHLADQLLFLLENSKGFTPASTPCPRSPGDSSVVESLIEHEDPIDRTSDIETTPEHLLPGNIASSTEEGNQTIWQKSRTPVSKTSHVNKLPTPDKEVISEVMSQKLLENRTFQKKLANTINTVLQSPEIATGSDKIEADKNNVNPELNETVKSVIKRTENDPIFDEMLEELLGTTVGDTISKAITLSTAPPTSSYNTVSYDSSQNKNILTLPENSGGNAPINDMSVKNNESQDNFNILTQTSTPKASVADPSPCQDQIIPSISTSQAQSFINTTANSVYVLTQPQQSQQLYVFNQPYVTIPQTQPTLIQVGQPCAKPVIMPAKPYKEQEIMSMPTIFINERNEITTPSADTNTLAATPLKVNEVCNVQEYLTLYGSTDQSPIVKMPKRTRRSKPLKISPMPTVRVEFCARDVPEAAVDPPPLPSTSKADVLPKPVVCTELPNLNESIIEIPPPQTVNDTTSQCQKDVPVTPPPVATTSRRNTPKSSSHVRNLTFPSPLKRTPTDRTRIVTFPSTINKKQATKDLFKEKARNEMAEDNKKENESKQLNEELSKTDAKGKKATDKDRLKTPKKQNKPKVSSWDKGSCWDANLRKMVTINEPIIEEECSPTPIKRIKLHNNANYVSEKNNSEDMLKTPNNKSKLRRKSLNKSVDKTPKEVKPDALVQQTVVEKHVKNDTKVLSPSKLNANKRNLLTTDLDNITPDNPKDTVQYPVSSRKKRNINQLLESPTKDFSIPPTPGGTPGKLDTMTPFTPMLKANLKDFAAGDNIFSIDTPNFPITPGFSIVSHTNDYYIPKANETDKVTEAIVVLEEKKSSVRSTDTDMDEEYDCGTVVYGGRDVLENFNKSRVGKKNLELLDKKTITWDLNSDKDETSENGDESNDVTSAVQSSQQPKQIKTILPKKSRTIGKHMDVLKSQLLPEVINDNSEIELSNQSSVKDSNTKSTEKQETGQYNQTTEVIRSAISNVKFDTTSTLMLSGYSMKKQLEQKKERIIQKEKYAFRNTPGRANNKSRALARTSKVKKASPKKTGKVTQKKAGKELVGKNHPTKCSASDTKRNSNENEPTDVSEQFNEPFSQDEFFKKSGTNLHRKNKDADNSSSDQVATLDIEENCRKYDDELSEINSLEHKKDVPGKDSHKSLRDNPQNSDDNDERFESESDLSFDTYYSCSEYAVYIYDEQRAPERKLEDYGLGNLPKSLRMTVPCSDGKDVNIVCSISPFETLLDIKSSFETDVDAAIKNSEQLSDCENTDDTEDSKKSRKRKRRSDSCGSNSSGKKSNVKCLLNPNNIENLLTKLHGPS
ncbi:hypothetical protein GWI33_021922 [Rhynchophorus ferrugineus]|uniref:Uncharacterized protein n=1 Tax=Rhynchophorus ferrugineus TaxID=354439 RepID=A0A834HQ34_RHYFE|nr:hypothetical protein GWI33_021922 [Rhynchophorus ferrugineus]